VQITVRSSPVHCLERSLARFLRLPRAALCRFSCLIPEGCRPDLPLGSVGRTRAFFACRSMGTVVDRQRLIRPQPHSRHSGSSQHPALSSLGRGSQPRRSSILRAAQPHIRHIALWPALRASSELALPSISRPARQTRTCPSACPCPGSSPITRRFADRAHPGAI
jgi:hypothetical protein